MENTIEVEKENILYNVLSIGEVTTGEEAIATITGKEPNQVLNLVLPKGEKGDTGEKGDVGEKGDKGEAFKFSDFTQEQLESLKGPQGERGETGEQGPPGIQGLPGEDGIVDYNIVNEYIDNKIGDINTILATLTSVQEVNHGNN